MQMQIFQSLRSMPETNEILTKLKACPGIYEDFSRPP